jgi:tetratricopeptide (TPR) repeat protein
MWHTFANQDWPQGLVYMNRAVELDSTSSFPRLFRVWPLLALGHTEDALAEVREAVKLDPLAPTERARLGTILITMGRHDEAIASLRTALELDPSNLQAQFELGRAFARKGQYDEAFKHYPDIIELQAGLATGSLAVALGQAGRRADAQRMYDRMLALSKRRPVLSEGLAQAALGSGNKELALDWLERAVREHSFYLFFLNDDPSYVPLRAYPRFQALLRQLRFPKPNR